MPYLDQHRRDMLDAKLLEIHKLAEDNSIDEFQKYRWSLSAGDINYIISSLLVHCCFGDNYDSEDPDTSFEQIANYARFNELIGALESAKLEFYRRIVSSYEDAKIEENGDMY